MSDGAKQDFALEKSATVAYMLGLMGNTWRRLVLGTGCVGNGVHESVSTRVRVPSDVIGESHRGLACDSYADDAQLYISTRPDETSKLSKLTECVKNIKDWMTNHFLLLNSDKTEILLIGPKKKNSTQNHLDHNLQLDGCPVPSSIVKNMGVILDSNLSFEINISHFTKTAFFHLRNIAKLSVSDTEKLVHAFMISRLDYCNVLQGGYPASSINKLQIVQNAAARVLTRSRKYDHITLILQSLHWLPIKFRISYKILLLTYKALKGLATAYLTSLLSRYNPTRSLRSQNSGLLVVPRIAKSTKGGRTFSYLAPKLWNSLPDNVQGSDTLSLFKSRLKTHIFLPSIHIMHLIILYCSYIWSNAHYYALAWVDQIIVAWMEQKLR